MNLQALKRLRPVNQALQRMRRVGGRAFMRAAHALGGARPKRVFFSSFSGRSYSDSPARITECLHGIRPDVEIVWQLQRPAEAPDYVRAVKPHTPAALWMISTAKCIVDNFNRPKYMLKFPDQLYVQTWHGDRGFKKMLFDMGDGQTFPDGEQMDLGVSGSDFGTKNYRTAFRYTGEVMQLGMPRNDALVRDDPAERAEIRRRLGVPEGARVLLYTPTFRNATAGSAQAAGFDFGRVLDRLECTGERWVALSRSHSQNRGVAAAPDPRLRDVTDWPETAELLLAADLLISDYSSVAGDYVLLDRPVILYQPDIDEFMADDRQMYFDLRTCPYARAESESELMALLDDLDALRPCCEKVRAFYGVTETGASARAVAQWIADRIR